MKLKIFSCSLIGLTLILCNPDLIAGLHEMYRGSPKTELPSLPSCSKSSITKIIESPSESPEHGTLTSRNSVSLIIDPCMSVMDQLGCRLKRNENVNILNLKSKL